MEYVRRLVEWKTFYSAETHEYFQLNRFSQQLNLKFRSPKSKTFDLEQEHLQLDTNKMISA